MPLHAPARDALVRAVVEEDATGPDVLPGGTLVALDAGGVVGFAGLMRRRADPHLAEHGLTSVAASHRNRGIATALKRAQLAWASRHGYRELMTSTQAANAPMRAVNEKLGYEPRPAWIRMEASLDDVEAALERREARPVAGTRLPGREPPGVSVGGSAARPRPPVAAAASGAEAVQSGARERLRGFRSGRPAWR